MQTMIAQFQEQDLLVMLKVVEEKSKTKPSITEMQFELHNLNILLIQFHEKLKRLIQID
jgi:hypothetical protein